MPEEYDFVIVGAGSAGCVLADRLSADPANRVLVIEFGGSDRSVFIQMPSALSIPMNKAKYNWQYETEPEPHLGGRRLHTPRGKVLGGSSSINGLVYVRGNPMDFERWADDGATGWSYRDVLPYFRRAETRDEGGDAHRGGDGALHTRYGRLENPLLGHGRAGRIIWDFPGPFLRPAPDKPPRSARGPPLDYWESGYRRPSVPSSQMRAYLDRPRHRLMDTFDDPWELAAILRAADRRLGRACLLEWARTLDAEHPALAVIETRFAAANSWPHQDIPAWSQASSRIDSNA